MKATVGHRRPTPAPVLGVLESEQTCPVHHCSEGDGRSADDGPIRLRIDHLRSMEQVVSHAIGGEHEVRPIERKRQGLVAFPALRCVWFRPGSPVLCHKIRTIRCSSLRDLRILQVARPEDRPHSVERKASVSNVRFGYCAFRLATDLSVGRHSLDPLPVCLKARDALSPCIKAQPHVDERLKGVLAPSRGSSPPTFDQSASWLWQVGVTGEIDLHSARFITQGSAPSHVLALLPEAGTWARRTARGPFEESRQRSVVASVCRTAYRSMRETYTTLRESRRSQDRLP